MATIRVYKSNNSWVVKKDGAGRALAKKRTQRDAYLAAREIALRQNLTITVYHPNGGIKSVINPRNREEESNCFITTSCVKYYDLSDNCYELQTLRKFRDTYLLKSPEGEKLVKEYYSIAPELVKKLEHSQEKKTLYFNIFQKIKAACIEIENRNYIAATNIYKQSVADLYYYFKKN